MLDRYGVTTADNVLDYIWWDPVPKANTLNVLLRCGHTAVLDFLARLRHVHPEVMVKGGKACSTRSIARWLADNNTADLIQRRDYGVGVGKEKKKLRREERISNYIRPQRDEMTAGARALRHADTQAAHLRQQYAGYQLDSAESIIDAGKQQATKRAGPDGKGAGIVQLLEQELRRQAQQEHVEQDSRAAALTARFTHAVALIDLERQLDDNASRPAAEQRPLEDFGSLQLRLELNERQAQVQALLKCEERRIHDGTCLPDDVRPVVNDATPTTSRQWRTRAADGGQPVDTYGLYAAACHERRYASIKYAVFVFSAKCCASTCRQVITSWGKHAFVSALDRKWENDARVARAVDHVWEYSNMQVVTKLLLACLICYSPLHSCHDWRVREL